MTLSNCFRSIALIALMLTGCVGNNNPAPRLDSPGRTEPVKDANNNDAAPAPAARTVNKPAEPPSQRFRPTPLISGGQLAGDDRAIAGSWAMQAGDQLYFWIFAANGTCKEAAGIVGPGGKLFFIYHAEGTYHLLPDQEIEVTYHTGPNDRKVGKRKYRLSKDTLELQTGDHWLKFKRATQ